MTLRAFTTAVGLLAAVVVPFFFSAFTLTIATNALVFAMLAVSLNLIVGSAGLPSLGHAAFFGTGAYAVGLARISHSTDVRSKG